MADSDTPSSPAHPTATPDGSDDGALHIQEPKTKVTPETLKTLVGARQPSPSPRLASRPATPTDPAKTKRDEYIMDTNNSSIVSKRSVEKLYYAGEPEYFRHFVSKYKRRSPLINRGYWLRMKAVDHTVTRFLAERTAKRRLVINLGCG